ncbi:C39 family peptidase [Candidatus Daviesbacteria bacterium]|nr:C39 family peptidase [Candidatus Daviesbacteria bacterium]
MTPKDMVFKLLTISKKTTKLLYQPTEPNVIYKDFPYYSQWVLPELVDKILSHKIAAREDKKWKSFGARNPEEYLHVSWNGCGMACLQMILKHKLKKNIPLVKLFKSCMEYGGYKINSEEYKKGNPRNSVEGLFYKPFVKFLHQEFDLSAAIISPMVIEDIIQALENGKYVIVSVNPDIRTPQLKPEQVGGHLVIVTGFDWNKRVLYIHNPSGFYQVKNSQQYAPVRFKDFEKFFAYRGIVID